MIPTLLIPRLCSLRNSIVKGRTSKLRLTVIGGVSLLLSYFVYRGTVALAQQLLVKVDIPIHFVFHSLLTILFPVLFFSNCINALSSLFLAGDLELVLASPLRKRSVFIGKMSEVVFCSSWMTMVLVIPMLAGLGAGFGAGLDYYLAALITALLLALIPASCAFIAVIIFASIVPLGKTREILAVGGLFLAAVLYLSLEWVSYKVPGNEAAQILELSSMVGRSYGSERAGGLAHTLSDLAQSERGSSLKQLAIPVLVLATSLGLAFATFSLLHSRAYSKSRSGGSPTKLASRTAQDIFRRLTPGLGKFERALIAKELRSFSREVTHAVQLVLLLVLAVLYLYQFRFYRIGDSAPERVKVWWEAFLLVANTAIGHYIMTAVSARFVFPSISLEGRSFWLLQSAPIEIKRILRIKFLCWFTLLGIISSVILISGVLAAGSSMEAAVLSAGVGLIISYGLVGTGIGLGAVFARFDWEHPAQITASPGNLAYVIAGISLVGANMVPTALLMAAYAAGNSSSFPSVVIEGISIASVGALIYLNLTAARMAINTGAERLRRNFS